MFWIQEAQTSELISILEIKLNLMINKNYFRSFPQIQLNLKYLNNDLILDDFFHLADTILESIDTTQVLL